MGQIKMITVVCNWCFKPFNNVTYTAAKCSVCGVSPLCPNCAERDTETRKPLCEACHRDKYGMEENGDPLRDKRETRLMSNHKKVRKSFEKINEEVRQAGLCIQFLEYSAKDAVLSYKQLCGAIKKIKIDPRQSSITFAERNLKIVNWSKEFPKEEYCNEVEEYRYRLNLPSLRGFPGTIGC